MKINNMIILGSNNKFESKFIYFYYYLIFGFIIINVNTIKIHKINEDIYEVSNLNGLKENKTQFNAVIIENKKNKNILNFTSDGNNKLKENFSIKQKCDLKKLKEENEIKKESRNINERILISNETIINDTKYLNNTSNSTTIRNYSTTNITSDDILSIIADQTENIKNEICSSCLEINSTLNLLIEEIKIIKRTLKEIVRKPSDPLITNKATNQINQEIAPSREIYSNISNCINNLNLIKADLFKLNEIQDTLQKANCKSFAENSKKYALVVNSANKLLEEIQNVIHISNINIKLVVLN